MTLLDTRASTRSESPPPAASPPNRLGALDGLRGISVLAVMAFHAGLSAVRGGLLGVDVFFVLSGFLITSLFLREYQRQGRISLRGFWLRRARRLLPAAVVMVGVVYAVSWYTADPSTMPGLRSDALSTLGYVANWHFALAGQGYFDHFAAPSPLLHMWSLAVEEQYYLLWPLVVVVTLRLRGPRLLARVSLFGAALSTAWLIALSLEGVSTSRLYYGTDTRIAALLVGSALATTLTPFSGSASDEAPRRTRAMAILMSVITAIALVAALLRIDGEAPALYRGGFLAIAVLVALLMTGVLLAPAGPVARMLSVPPLRGIGRISYGLYLWHWPVFLFLSSRRTGFTGPLLLGTRVGATLAIATVSWFLVERPILRWRSRRRLSKIAMPTLSLAVIGGLVAALILVPSPKTFANSPTLNLDKLEQEQADAPPPPPPRTSTAGPTRVLVVGDSTALTLGVGLSKVGPMNKTIVSDRGRVGCGISTASPIRIGGNSGPIPDQCSEWQDDWTSDVSRYDPDVAVVLLGRWEVPDRVFNGRWTSLGDPAYNAYLSDRLDRAISILSAKGAKVALLTAPYYQSNETADGQQPDEDTPARVDQWNELLRQAAARHPDVARTYEFGAMLSPHGHYQRFSDDGRLELRAPDGIHIGLTGGMFLGHVLLPQFRAWDLGEETLRSDATAPH